VWGHPFGEGGSLFEERGVRAYIEIGNSSVSAELLQSRSLLTLE